MASKTLTCETIYVYDEDLLEAINTLRHEYPDCLLTRKLVNPLVILVNTFIRLREKEIYMGKERTVIHLLRLIYFCQGGLEDESTFFGLEF